MRHTHPPIPTADQCSGNARLPDLNGNPAYACWYPQMGGYLGLAVVTFHPPHENEDGDGCFDVYVWHDGEFPFDAEDGQPFHLHHCSPTQFIQFGQSVLAMMGNPAKN